MKFLKFICIFAFFFIVIINCKQKQESETIHGVVLFVKGSAELEHNGAKTPVEKEDVFEEGDTIYTGEDSIVIVKLNNGLAQMEIQPNAIFQLEKIKNKEKSLSLQKGNVWLQVNKLTNGDSLELKSPTAVASVRGTKFYTFEMNGMYGTCHCEGDVEFTGTDGQYKQVHQTDTVVFTKEGKTIILTSEDLKELNFEHNHSKLEDSPLGKKASLTPEQAKQMMDLINKKFSELK